MNVQQFLKEREVPFDVVTHAETFDAQHLAHAVHVPGIEVAKTVLLRLDAGGIHVVAVLPATHRVNLQRVSQVFGGARVELATEEEITERCPDCEKGVLPLLGSLYGLETLVDESLALDEEIVFEGNTHREAIRMKYRDFYELEHPLVASFAHRV